MRLTSDQLSIYLHDHLAGAKAGSELARRARRQNEGTPYGAFLADLERQINEDRATLLKIMERLDTGRDELKEALAWTGEKLGRLKFNGRLTGYAPLSRMVELEALTLGVQGKLCMWRSLREIAPHHQKLDVAELDQLIRRAEHQLDGLAEHHRKAAVDAFRDGSPGAG
jgi:uncharacterized tellurite resistance protein B-like protein